MKIEQTARRSLPYAIHVQFLDASVGKMLHSQTSDSIPVQPISAKYHGTITQLYQGHDFHYVCAKL